MSRQMLNKFFENNEPSPGLPSAQAFAHFQIFMAMNKEYNDTMQGIMNGIVFQGQPKRETEANAQKQVIYALDSGKEVVRMMRGAVDPIVHSDLIEQALKFEDDVIPEIMRRVKTSLNTGFIELAALALAMCGKNIADEICEMYDGVRNPYTQGLLLLVLGFKAGEDKIPWLIEQYGRLKKYYPEETYCEGAYYALYEMDSRLYPKN